MTTEIIAEQQSAAGSTNRQMVPPERSKILTAWLSFYFILYTGFSVILLAALPGHFTEKPLEYVGTLILDGLYITVLVGIWRWRKWGVFGYFILFGGSAILGGRSRCDHGSAVQPRDVAWGIHRTGYHGHPGVAEVVAFQVVGRARFFQPATSL
jgi:hypothetical protein